MMDCLFCQIAEKKIPAALLHEDEFSVAFRDLNPQAPSHILIIPKKHVERLSVLEEADKNIAGHLLIVAQKLAKDLNLGDFRLNINNGPNAGQTVWHLHLHLLSGRNFAWPPG